MKITINSVAEKAGVSVATVSRVLNQKEGYSEDTRLKVLKIMKEMGYQPNALAQGLAGKRTQTIGVLIPKLSSMVASTILNGLEDAAHKKEHSVIICNTDNDGKRTTKYLQVLRQRQIEGLIIVSQQLSEEEVIFLKKMKIPILLISTANENFKHIKVNDYAASYDATKYLIEKGHEKILFLSGTKSDPIAGLPRVFGYQQALKDHGFKVKPELIIYGDFDYESGKVNMKRALEKKLDFTSVFAASDEMAVGALNIAYNHGLKIPAELSIISYDGTKLSEMSTPPLTVLNQPFYKMGFDGLNMLIDNINGQKVVSRDIPYSIIERESIKRLS